MADITFQCPECKQHLAVDADGAGQQVQCPTCSQSITVPKPLPQPLRSSSISKLRLIPVSLIIVVFAAVICVCLAGVGLWIIKHRTVNQDTRELEQSPVKEQKDSAKNDIVIDLIAATVNGRPINNMTVDNITDLFGRPSETITLDKGWPRILICYNQIGLEFGCYQTNCVGINIFLVEESDELSLSTYNGYNGSLSRNVNSNWKCKQVIDAFSDYKAADMFEVNRERREANTAAIEAAKEDEIKVEMDLSPGDTYSEVKDRLEKEHANELLNQEKMDSTIYADLGTHELFFDYDRTSKFINKIRIVNK